MKPCLPWATGHLDLQSASLFGGPGPLCTFPATVVLGWESAYCAYWRRSRLQTLALCSASQFLSEKFWQMLLNWQVPVLWHGTCHWVHTYQPVDTDDLVPVVQSGHVVLGYKVSCHDKLRLSDGVLVHFLRILECFYILFNGLNLRRGIGGWI